MLKEVKQEIRKPYMQRLQNKILQDNFRVPIHKPFILFEKANLKNVNMVIVGQDPYSTGVVEGGVFKYYYDGIAFSSRNTSKTPYSLKVMQDWFIRTEKIRGLSGEVSNDLQYLVDRGIVLMNTVWSVSYGKPLSHDYPEWYTFTAFTLRLIQKYNENVVFLLLGAEAARMQYAIDESKHKVFRAKHPAASRYKLNTPLDKSDVLLQCMQNTTYPIRLLK